jgi:hypothetical protein
VLEVPSTVVEAENSMSADGCREKFLLCFPIVVDSGIAQRVKDYFKKAFKTGAATDIDPEER